MLSLEQGGWDVLGVAAAGVRRAVFVQEMGLSPVLQEDADDRQAVHVVARNQLGMALATGRLSREPDGRGRLARIAVLRSMRYTGLGRQVVRTLLRIAAERGDRELVLSAQSAAAGLYAALGFENASLPYMDSGLEHIEMKLDMAQARASL